MGNYIRDLWRDMRGNAAWDAGCWIWHHIPTTWVSFAMTGIFLISQWLASAPWPILVLLSSVIFGLSMLGFNQLDALRDRRRRGSAIGVQVREIPSLYQKKLTIDY